MYQLDLENKKMGLEANRLESWEAGRPESLEVHKL
jgi:hypothetical protein